MVKIVWRDLYNHSMDGWTDRNACWYRKNIDNQRKLISI